MILGNFRGSAELILVGGIRDRQQRNRCFRVPV
jgi:hypothetical protein